MTIIEESNIRHAVYTGNGRELAEAVRHASPFLEYSELEKVVLDTPGGFGCVSYNGIAIEGTTVRDRYGRPEVRR